MNILAIYAHPGDAEAACGGTLLKYRQAGHTLFLAVVTSGNASATQQVCRESLAKQREAEQRRSAQLLQAQLRLLPFDEGLLCDTPQSRAAVHSAIRWANPDVILTHHPMDFETDHAMTAKLVTQTLLSVGGTLHTADLAPIEKKPAVFFTSAMAEIGVQSQLLADVTAQEAEKLTLVRCHASQFPQTGADSQWRQPDERIQAVDHMRGHWCGCRFAEGFTAHQILGYCADYRRLP